MSNKLGEMLLILSRRGAEDAEDNLVMRKPAASSRFIFIEVIRKSIVEDAKLGNNTPFSAPPRALREIFLRIFFELMILGRGYEPGF